MANFIDDRQEEPTEEFESLEETPEEEQEQPTEEVSEAEESNEGSDDIPDKYRGKDIKDIVAMHQNAEQLLGKQGQEVGELRKIVDDFIKSQTVKQQETAQNALDEIDDDAFFANPKETIQKILDNHPSVQQSKELAQELKKQEIVARLKATHPDFMDVVKSPDFGEWVAKSKVRTRLLQEADSNYDFDSADELLTLWKERQEAVKSAVEVEQTQRKQQVKAASSGSSKGSGEKPARKIYRRADIIELMRKDPSRYEALMPEIRQAYAEGRVK
jgi:hypothetical protein